MPVAHAQEAWTSPEGPVVFDSEESYFRYIQPFLDMDIPTSRIEIDLPNNITMNEGDYIDFNLHVPEAGLYSLEVVYMPLPGNGLDIELQLEINGTRPYFEARFLTLNRVWQDARNVRENLDLAGNEIRPAQTEVVDFFTQSLIDGRRTFTGAMLFFLDKGESEIRLTVVRENIEIRELTFVPKFEPSAYVRPQNLNNGSGQIVATFEAEEGARKSTPMLIPEFDRASPYTSPVSNRELFLNMIGGERWSIPGQWLEWTFDVPTDGYYKIGFRSRQNILAGGFTSRRLYINGEVPFAEAESVHFDHSNRWSILVPQVNNEPMYFWLNAGSNTIRLEATLGDMIDYFMVVQEMLLALNECFRDIIMLTGTNPDIHRDYYFELEIPHVFENFAEIQTVLNEVHVSLQEMGLRGERIAVFGRMDRVLTTITQDYRQLVRRMNELRHMIGALGTWLQIMLNQPLDLDRIYIAEPGAEFPRADAGFLRRMWHEITMFFNSFFTDFNSIQGIVENSIGQITVWTSASRDQVSIIRQMIDETFSPETGIEVNLQLVAGGALLPSVLAGIGPDVALSEGSGGVLNFAARGALYDLSGFKNLEKVTSRFSPEALVPLYHLDGLYGIPETHSYSMLFYRADIFADLGLAVPNTWDEVHILLSEITRRNMSFGMPTEMGSFPMFLFQNGGEFFQDNNRRVNLTSDEAINAFRMQTDMFVSYELPLAFDFANRFRSGEMPISIQDFTTFNMLNVFAPEIKGLWDFVPIPGIIQEDGTIDRSTGIGVSATIMLAQTNEPELSFDFIDWFSSVATQMRYGREMETILGPAARFNTANIEAMRGLGWSRSELAALEYQLEHVTGVPEVLGGYYLGRFVGQAFREVVLNNRLHREVLASFERIINEEMQFARIRYE